jgi:predicted GIY-YIG superfamily endonuclease
MDGDLGPAWLNKAIRVARTYKASTRAAPRARHSVYVVLLHDQRRPEPWGLYVGQTSRDPDHRFDQHKSGYKASGAVRRFGIRLLPEIVEHLNPMRAWESLELEAALAEAFSAAGIPWIEGGH